MCKKKFISFNLQNPAIIALNANASFTILSIKQKLYVEFLEEMGTSYWDAKENFILFKSRYMKTSNKTTLVGGHTIFE